MSSSNTSKISDSISSEASPSVFEEELRSATDDGILRPEDSISQLSVNKQNENVTVGSAPLNNFKAGGGGKPLTDSQRVNHGGVKRLDSSTNIDEYKGGSSTSSSDSQSESGDGDGNKFTSSRDLLDGQISMTVNDNQNASNIIDGDTNSNSLNGNIVTVEDESGSALTTPPPPLSLCPHDPIIRYLECGALSSIFLTILTNQLHNRKDWWITPPLSLTSHDSESGNYIALTGFSVTAVLMCLLGLRIYSRLRKKEGFMREIMEGGEVNVVSSSLTLNTPTESRSASGFNFNSISVSNSVNKVAEADTEDLKRLSTLTLASEKDRDSPTNYNTKCSINATSSSEGLTSKNSSISNVAVQNEDSTAQSQTLCESDDLNDINLNLTSEPPQNSPLNVDDVNVSVLDKAGPIDANLGPLNRGTVLTRTESDCSDMSPARKIVRAVQFKVVDTIVRAKSVSPSKFRRGTKFISSKFGKTLSISDYKLKSDDKSRGSTSSSNNSPTSSSNLTSKTRADQRVKVLIQNSITSSESLQSFLSTVDLIIKTRNYRLFCFHLSWICFILSTPFLACIALILDWAGAAPGSQYLPVDSKIHLAMSRMFFGLQMVHMGSWLVVSYKYSQADSLPESVGNRLSSKSEAEESKAVDARSVEAEPSSNQDSEEVVTVQPVQPTTTNSNLNLGNTTSESVNTPVILTTPRLLSPPHSLQNPCQLPTSRNFRRSWRLFRVGEGV